MLAERLAQLLRERNKGDEADKWMKEAQPPRAARTRLHVAWCDPRSLQPKV